MIAKTYPVKIFTPAPMLGYGYDIVDFWTTIMDERTRPDAIIMDSGSTDPGPYMLGSGRTIVSKQPFVHDLSPVLEACAEFGIKLLISSAGGAGTNEQVNFLVGLVREISERKGYRFKVSTIKFKNDRQAILKKLRAGAITPCGPGPALKEEDVLNAVAVVAQMGAEPFMKALEDPEVDIIISGRSYDPAPFAAYSMHRGVHRDPAWHMGKIVECGGQCAVPKGRSILATMYQDSFELTPITPGQRCIPRSVAAHTMYEKTRPDRLPGPGGVLHLDNVQFKQQEDNRSILIHGATFVPTPTYQIKLEGATQVGFRSAFIGGIRDPILIQRIDDFLEKTVRARTKAAFPLLGEPAGPQLIFHIYGRNAVMGPLEPASTIPHEIGVLGEVVAETQEDADAIAGLARVMVLHAEYPGQLATAGNFASPLTPLEQSVGPVYKFSIYHLMDVEDPLSFFPIESFFIGSPNDNKTKPVPSERPVRRPEDVVTTLPDAPRHNITSSRPRISDLAAVVRSKNSGPYEITLDILFDDARIWKHVRDSNVLTPDVMKRIYRLCDDDILTCMFFEPALGWKCTFKRPANQLQGSVGERDTFGTQLHAPLLDVEVPALNLA
ncbi:uncharacterized protein Z519_10983 [Cladophialophora bantiana CBS 173.52]|uniref:Uncharacterized protein n=1 Tax=Cladophialophora bantiana (strain ATCC 10958 / CBS 173.52 / CDC B-1940 / NIH 8579) TaxID=1442370 RepID=A0A0D2HV72_CLAB1|nr:uncharacterized protein Z519_10983 [Cladophialophora bantiana CBS 173.52]KIW88414.1 hypothetical protein Z519_10983 [Cladophialophora bantiana CBS 173.52]